MPRLLDLDLGLLGPAPRPLDPRPFADPDPSLARVGALGGGATGLAALLAAVRREPAAPAPLVLAVGEAVRRGLPTAARATVLSRAPLGGFLAEGQVGGDLGPRLAALTDVLLLRGSAGRGGNVLVVAPEGAWLERRPELLGLDPAATHRALVAAHPGAATLRVGPGGEAGLPFASLASGDEAASFVGRGGLGAVLARLGLKALVVRAPLAPADRTPAGGGAELVRALSASPRLEARSEGGTLELFAALAAGGELPGRADGEVLAAAAGEDLYRDALGRRRERKGCRGCPTPCGWTFAREGGAGTQRAHFGASQALGPPLGLARFEDSLELLAACDRAGLDAKEVGAALALVARAREEGTLAGRPLHGDRAALLAAVEDLAARRPGSEELQEGAVALARRLGLEARLPSVRGQVVRPEQDRVALLGQCVSAGGTDPMRSFPFLIEAGGRARLSLWTGVSLDTSSGASDGASPWEDAFLVAWHESLVAGLDALGFCAFSAAGLLADGVCDLERLAAWIVPEGWEVLEGAASPGARLLAAGAATVAVRRELNACFGDVDAAERPAWLSADAGLAAGVAAYRELRGLDARGRPGERTWAAVGTAALWERTAALARERVAPPARPEVEGEHEPAARGRVTLRAVGPLADALGRLRTVEHLLPASLVEVLGDLAAAEPALAARLVRGGEPVPGAFRAGRRLRGSERLRDGDEIVLVSAIRGG